MSGEGQVTYTENPVMEFAELVSSTCRPAEHSVLLLVQSFVVAVAH